MRKLRWHLFVCTYLIYFTGLVSSVSAQSNSLVKNGIYLGAMFVHNSVSGDFNDSWYDGAGIVPNMHNGEGFDIVLGYKVNKFSYELGYQRTKHTMSSSFEFLGDKSTYNIIDFDFKYDLISNSQLRPYALLGGGVSWITVEPNAVAVYDMTGLKDETFKGYCLNLGAGVAYYIKPQIALTCGIKYRWNTFDKFEDEKLNENLKENILSTSIGISFTF